MKLRKGFKIVLISFLVGIGLVLWFGIKIPPKTLKSIELPIINSINVYALGQSMDYTLSESDLIFWKSLNFKIEKERYPGTTPDYLITLQGDDFKFLAMHNTGGDLVFFSFLPFISYGFLNSPPAGGWTGPLYAVKASDQLLQFLQVNK